MKAGLPSGASSVSAPLKASSFTPDSISSSRSPGRVRTNRFTSIVEFLVLSA